MNNWTTMLPNGYLIYGAQLNDEYGDDANTPVNQEFGGFSIRKGCRGGLFVIDVEFTAAGFGGTEGVDWKNVVKFY